jgi:hypothetical protein
MLNKFQVLIRSRKFWASIVGVGLIVLRTFVPSFPIADADLTKIVFVIVAYVLGTGLEDSKAYPVDSALSLAKVTKG